MARKTGHRDPRKTAAILAAAAEIFRDQGLEASLEIVAAKARVAKQTVYNHFRSKAELLEELVRRRAQIISAPLHHAKAHHDPRATLLRLAEIIVGILHDPEPVGMLRMIIANAAQFPDLALMLYERGFGETRRQLAQYLAEEHEAKRVCVDEPLLAAEYFHALVVGNDHMRLLFGQTLTSDPARIKARAQEAVRIFWLAYGPQAAARSESDRVATLLPL